MKTLSFIPGEPQNEAAWLVVRAGSGCAVSVINLNSNAGRVKLRLLV